MFYSDALLARTSSLRLQDCGTGPQASATPSVVSCQKITSFMLKAFFPSLQNISLEFNIDSLIIQDTFTKKRWDCWSTDVDTFRRSVHYSVHYFWCLWEHVLICFTCCFYQPSCFRSFFQCQIIWKYLQKSLIFIPKRIYKFLLHFLSWSSIKFHLIFVLQNRLGVMWYIIHKRAPRVTFHLQKAIV